MVAFETEGEMTREEFDTIVLPAVMELIQRTGKLNFLLIMDAEFDNFIMGAWLKESMNELHYMNKWNRVAVITNTVVVQSFSDLLARIRPGEFRGFNKRELYDAIPLGGRTRQILQKGKIINQF